MPNLATESLALRVQAEQIAAFYTAQPPHVGAPSALGDADRVQQFLAAIVDGVSRETACKIAGLAKQTFYNWLKRAEHGDEAAQQFVDALEKAEGGVEARISRNMLKASDLPQFWAAGATWAERRYPERWGKRQDDSATPRVVVQIGAGTTDVSVNIRAGADTLEANALPVNELIPSSHMTITPLIRPCVEADQGLVVADTADGRANPPGAPAGAAVAPLAAERSSGQRRRRGAGKKKS